MCESASANFSFTLVESGPLLLVSDPQTLRRPELNKVVLACPRRALDQSHNWKQPFRHKRLRELEQPPNVCTRTIATVAPSQRPSNWDSNLDVL